jgi:pSer/pThr/pTyr-binding forkhead associated (FHA) protein
VLQFGEAIILGREAATGEGEHMLDLTPFGGNEKGVSRRHAAIQRVKNSVVLMDLGSSNNTFINGQRLASHEPHILIERDEIRLGNLVASISFGPVGKAIR